MVLSSSSDEWCRHSDRAIQGFPFTKKIVDDILVWASNLLELYDRIWLIAKRCESLNIALNHKKFKIGSEISFTGLLLTEKGIKPDPARVSALSDFPVRSYVGAFESSYSEKKIRFSGCQSIKRILRR